MFFDSHDAFLTMKTEILKAVFLVQTEGFKSIRNDRLNKILLRI